MGRLPGYGLERFWSGLSMSAIRQNNLNSEQAGGHKKLTERGGRKPSRCVCSEEQSNYYVGQSEKDIDSTQIGDCKKTALRGYQDANLNSFAYEVRGKKMGCIFSRAGESRIRGSRTRDILTRKCEGGHAHWRGGESAEGGGP